MWQIGAQIFNLPVVAAAMDEDIGVDTVVALKTFRDLFPSRRLLATTAGDDVGCVATLLFLPDPLFVCWLATFVAFDLRARLIADCRALCAWELKELER